MCVKVFVSLTGQLLCIHTDAVGSAESWTWSDEWELLQVAINFFPTLLWAYWLLLHTGCSGVSNGSGVQGSFRGAPAPDKAELLTGQNGELPCRPPDSQEESQI